MHYTIFYTLDKGVRVSDLFLPEVVDRELGHLVAEFGVGRVLDRHRRGELHAPDMGSQTC